MGELDFKRIKLKWADDDEFFCKDYKSKTFKTYGENNISVENDFQTNEKIIQSGFAPVPLTSNSYNDMVLPGILRENANTTTNNYSGAPRFVYFDANTTMAENYTIDGVAQTDFPFCGHLKGTLDAAAFDFNFAAPQLDRKSTRLNSSHVSESRMPSSA